MTGIFEIMFGLFDQFGLINSRVKKMLRCPWIFLLLFGFGLASFGGVSFGLATFSHAASSSGEDHPWDDWQEAKTNYDTQKFQEALKAFQEHPKNDASYHYNLGAVYYRLGKMGAALGHFEKANRMSPHDPDIQYNLSLVKNQLSRSIGAEKLDPASTWVEEISDRLSLDEVRTAIGLLGLILVLLWTKTYLSTQTLKTALLNPKSLLALAGFIVSSSVYGIQRWGDSCPPAILLQKQTIRSGPGDHFIELAQTDEGSKLRILGPSATTAGSPPAGNVTGDPTQQPEGGSEVWRQVRYSQEGIGWIRASSLLIL